MKEQPNLNAGVLKGQHLNMTTQEIKRQQQREEALDWISTNALSTLRLAWRSK